MEDSVQKETPFEATIPQYYRENYFSNDTLFYAETAVNDFGVAGDPVPHTVRGDTFMTLLLLVCFMAFIVSVAQTRNFLGRQLKHLFYSHLNDSDQLSETSGELRFQLFLIVMSCLLTAVVIYHYISYYEAATLVIDSELLVVGIFFAVMLGYQLFRGAAYSLVNAVFFSPRQNEQWMKTVLFLNASLGALVFPVVLLVVYFNLSLENALYYFFFIFIFVETVTIYKCWSIFFSQKDVFLQTFLYFCALELTPLLCLAGGIVVLIEQLRLNI